jgi:hypothetical protein
MKNGITSIACCFLVTVIILGRMFCCATAVFANESPQTTDICIVFDNTASTYQNETWCRYKYAMSIAADFIDFQNGGRLLLYPLCDVETNNGIYNANTDPIQISSSGDTYHIYSIYTTAPAAEASFQQIENAYNYLTRESAADNKLLFILTDSAFSDFASERDLESRLLQMVESQDVSICYFGTDQAMPVTAHGSRGLFTYYKEGVVNTRYLLDFILRYCAEPFQRTKLLTSASSMSKVHIKDKCNLIIFANGTTESFKLKAVEIKDLNGNSPQQLMQGSYNNYSKITAAGFEDAPIDTNLAGYVATYYICEPGEYYLNLNGADWADIYSQKSNDGTWVNAYLQNREASEKNMGNWFLVFAIAAGVGIVVFLTRLYLKGKNKKYQIFISYRRDGGDSLAGRIDDRLTRRGYKIFFDVETMRSGVFNEQIYHAIDECQDVLLILPPFALDRCVNEDDWVRKEIAYAIQKEKNIVPIMMRGFEFPKVLPEEIDKIRMMQGITASTEYFDAVIDKIEESLKCRKKGLQVFTSCS